MKDEKNARFFIEELRAVQYEESIFSRIMHAKTVQEILDLPANSEEIFSYMKLAEELGKFEEENIFLKKEVTEKIKKACPPPKGRRAFFI